MRYRTKCGGVLLITTKAQEHLRAHPEVVELLPCVAQRLVLPRNNTVLSTEVDMARVVGRAGRIAAPEIFVTDTALFARRVGRQHPSRVLIAEAATVSTVAVVAFPSRKEARTYVLVTAWVGTIAPREPWDHTIAFPAQFDEALRFWCTQAIVWDPAVMSEPYESSWAEVLLQTFP